MNENMMIIQNALVVRPDQKTMEKRTLYIADGKLAENIQPSNEPVSVFDASGCYVAPGFIDLHVHVFKNHAAIGILADQVGISQGVITVVDAGSTGIDDYPAFEKEVILKSVTDVKFFLNISRRGLCSGLSELADPNDLITAKELAAFQAQHRDRLVGLKVRMSGSVVKNQGLAPLKYARELADQSRLPLMVHIGNTPPELGSILNELRQGDIITHCFHGKPGGLADCPNEFAAAVQRGVRFDVGHGTASFSYERVPQVLKLQPIDFSISTDLYDQNFDTPVGSLMRTMSKFLPQGFTVPDLVRRVTVLPREILGMPPITMVPGDAADLTVFRIVEKQRTLVDSEGYQVVCDRYFEPVAAIKQGKRVWNSGL